MSRYSESLLSVSDISLSSNPSLISSVPSVRTSPPLLPSTPTASTPWSVTETVPPIFWSAGKAEKQAEEMSPVSEEQVDLREILRKKLSGSVSSIASESVVGIDRIEVTVTKGKDNRRVETDYEGEKGLETRKLEIGLNGDDRLIQEDQFDANADQQAYYEHYDYVESVDTNEDDEVEEGEISDSSFSVISKKVNCKTQRHLLSDLLKKKKVIEHLIDKVNREELGEDLSEVSEDIESSNLSSEIQDFEDSSNDVQQELETFEEISRKVVYRNSSVVSSSAGDQARSLYNDFSKEMETGLKELFPSKQRFPNPLATIKIEPINEDDVTPLSDAETTVAREQTEFVTATAPSVKHIHCKLCNVKVPNHGMVTHMKGKKHQYNDRHGGCSYDRRNGHRNDGLKTTASNTKQEKEGWRRTSDFEEKVKNGSIKGDQVGIDHTLQETEVNNNILVDSVASESTNIELREDNEKKKQLRKKIVWDLK
eukprot:GFUD01026396.1.p1 GENE.GFUD01026396.1~~GFUD01026396.1.p1  ORF type:complete len:482 (+),score=130.94 GFUD01026396.1:54-1499(+)